MKANHRMWLWVGMVILSQLISACSGATPVVATSQPAASTATAVPPAATATTEPVKLKLAVVPYLSNTIFIIAKEQGYFAEQNLDVELVPLQNTNDLITLLVSGELDAAAPAPNAAFFNAVARGGKIKAILPLTDFAVKDCATVAYLARKTDIEAGLFADKKSWSQARLVISTQALTSIPGYVLSQTLAPSGLTVDDMKVEVVDLAAQEEALRNRQVDIVYAVEPAITRMTAKGDIAVLDPAEQYVPGLTSSMVVAGPRITDNPEVGKRFALAYLKAVRQYLQGPTDNNIKMASELSKLPPELIKKMCWSNASPDGLFNIESIMSYQNWLLSRGLIDKVIDPQAFYEPAFAAEAVKVLGSQKP